MDLEREAWEIVDWIYFAQVNGRWRALAIAVTKLRAENSLSST
jgi:hypothetical protein